MAGAERRDRHDGSVAVGNRDVFLVDLSGTTDNRRIMRPLSRWLVGADVFVRRLLGRAGPRVLVFAPAADGKAMAWPESADLVFTDELLDGETVDRISDWVVDLSRRIVDAEPLWPSPDGISLGLMNLWQIQDFLLNYGQATESLRRLLDADPGGRCFVVSGYPEMANAIRRDVADRGAQIRVRTLPSYRPWFLHRNGGDRPDDAPPAYDAIPTDTRVLIVSESNPMAGLFGSVEPHLDRLGIGPNLRLQFDGAARGFEKRAGASILHVTRPEAQNGDARAPMDDAMTAALKQLTESAGPYRPPLDLLVHSLGTYAVPRQLRHLRTARRILERAQPDLVVVGNDRWWVGMAFVLVARQMGIPTLAVQDGVAWNTPMWTYSTADHVGVNGTQLESFLKLHGVPENRITVVGQPRYDEFRPEAAAAVREDARRAIGLEPDTYGVLFATQPNQDALYIRSIAEAILAVPDLTLLLRPHPSQGQRSLAPLGDILSNPRVKLVRDGAIFDLLAASDLVVVQNSTVALEAALLDRPVISANFTGLPGVVSFASCGLCAEATDADGVTELVASARAGDLLSAAQDPAAQAGIRYLIGPTDGRSAERVGQLIADLARSTHPAA